MPQFLKRKDGSISQRGLRDNIRAKAQENKAKGVKGKKPSKEISKQAEKILSRNRK